MKPMQIILAVLFIAQLLIAGGLYSASQSKVVVRPDGVLVEYDSDEIDGIEIQDSENSVTIASDEGNWVLPDYNNLPVQQIRVNTLLESINGAKTGWAVATKAASHQQLEVAEDKFTRRVELSKKDETVVELYVGTSPGLRRSHARKASDDEVYAIAINSYDLPAERSQWIDKSLLATDANITVTVVDDMLSQVGDSWKITDAEGNTQDADNDAAEEFINALKSMQIIDVADKDPVNGSKKTLITKSDNESLTYTFATANDEYFVRRSDFEPFFKINASAYEKIADSDLGEMVKKAEESESEPASDDSSDQSATTK